jgi:acetyl-CoA synthetase
MTNPNTADAYRDRIWSAIEARLDRDPHGPDFNTAHEACGRYANDPHRMAMIVRSESGTATHWTFHELDRHAAKAARVFARAGLRPGDRIAGLLSRQVESWITALAAWRSGLVYVPLFGGFGAQAIGERINTARVIAVVVDHHYRAALAEAQADHNLDLSVFEVRPRGHGAPDGDDRGFWAELDRVDADGPLVPTKISDTATLLFTSGTSGTPKACAMPHGAVISVLPYVYHVLGLSTGSSVFTTSDPAWAFGLYTTGVAVMATGTTRIVYSGRFAPQAWYRVITEEKASVLTTAPAALRRLTECFATLGPAPSLSVVATAGESLTATVAEQWTAAGGSPIRNAYGLSEIGMVLGDTVDTTDVCAPGKLAAPIPGFDTFLADRAGAPVPRGEPGRVAVRKPRHQLSTGYENAPDLWESRWCDGSFITEDRAVIDDRGRWQILGRDDDMIIASGHNISPVEVENALLAHHAVAEAAAVPFNDPTRGDVVRVVIVRSDSAPGGDVLDAELQDIVARKVGRYAIPRVIDYRSELPRTEVGKLRRSALR